jgi:hypothetical protein
MSREIINVGTVPNDGLGDPLRTAYIKCNNNFAELYDRAQPSPPPTLVGSPGDQAGMYAYDSTDFYFCFQDFDDSSVIWAVVSNSGNVAVTSISSGTSNVNIATASGPVTVGAGGVANVAIFRTTGANITGALTATGNVTGNYILGNGSQLTGLPATYGNSNVANYLPVYTGNFSPNILNATAANVAGNVTGGNLSVTGNTVLGNVTINTSRIIDIGNNRISNVSDPVANSDVATKSYIDSVLSSGITIQDDTANTTVLAGNATTLQLYGTANEVAVDITNTNQVTFGLPDNVSVTGNITVGNLIANSAIQATGNITTSGFFIGTFIGNVTGNLTVPGLNTQVLYNNAGNAGADSGFTYAGGIVTVTGNVAAGNLTTGGLVVATGNVTGGNLTTGGSLTVTGNATVGNIDSGGLATFTGNVTGGNLNTGGRVVASGNVSGNYILGNGSLLTGLSSSSISNGTSNVIVVANGNVTVSSTGSANVLIVTSTGANIAGTLNATGNANVGNLGATNIAGTLSTAAQTNITSVGTLGALTVTGNVSTGNVSGATGTFTNIAGTLSTAAQTNITSVGTLTSLSVTGNASAGNLSVSTGTVSVGNIENTNANGVGNIGTSANYFNTVFAKSTSAQYADLAEYYIADAKYEFGTVLKFGTNTEVSLADQDHDPAICGVVSCEPAFVMNSGLTGENVVAVALLGRTPCLVQGPVRRGQMMVSAGNGQARAETNPAMGTVIGKALENFDGDIGKIEILVGRL